MLLFILLKTVCISRRVKNGMIDRAFTKFQEKQTVRVKTEVISMDGTSVKIHPVAASVRIALYFNNLYTSIIIHCMDDCYWKINVWTNRQNGRRYTCRWAKAMKMI